MTNNPADIYKNCKPYTRWWWFSGPIKEEDIRFQLDWLKENNFGGVEMAWLYPLPGADPGPEWLSTQWSQIVAYAKKYAFELGLGCDFTFGSLWPFGGSAVEEKDASMMFGGLSPQRIRRSWEEKTRPPGYVLNHLDRNALARYSSKTGAALKKALDVSPSALFCDSWEVHPDKLWTRGFAESFMERFGYDVSGYMEKLDSHPDVRYDYRSLISLYVLEEFYKPFTEVCHGLGAVSRVQCHGAPADLIAAYAAVDVPESETVLFDPHFSQIAASAAALSSRNIVSAEAFTCLYGWKRYPGPAPYIKTEKVEDLKLVCDALFANGINFIIWHGMPYNPEGGSNEFYASVHVGPDSSFAARLPLFNEYMENVCVKMRTGKAYSQMAVYLPFEDNMMRNELPENLLRPSARYYWELQYQLMPEETRGYRPLWISRPFLEKAVVKDHRLRCGDADFESLYIDVEWLDLESLKAVLNLAEKDLPVILKRKPKQPGYRKSPDYENLLAELSRLENVQNSPGKLDIGPPLIEGDSIPEFFCRKEGERLLMFFAHPESRGIHYPLRYGQALECESVTIPLVINHAGSVIRTELKFESCQSIILSVEPGGSIAREDINFTP